MPQDARPPNRVPGFVRQDTRPEEGLAERHPNEVLVRQGTEDAREENPDEAAFAPIRNLLFGKSSTGCATGFCPDRIEVRTVFGGSVQGYVLDCDRGLGCGLCGC